MAVPYRIDKNLKKPETDFIKILLKEGVIMKKEKTLILILLVLVSFVFAGCTTTGSEGVSAAPVAEVVYPAVTGSVAEVQKYGNLTMDITPEALYGAGYELGDMLTVSVGDNQIEAPFCTAYSDVDTGNPLVRDDQKKGLLVVAINMGNFSKVYSAETGTQVTFTLKEKEGYKTGFMLHQLERTNNREDYGSDEIFANFRNIAMGDIPAGLVYRSSNPANNELGRASYADVLMDKAAVKTVVNLSDSSEELEGFFAREDYNSPYYQSVYEKGHIITLDMGVDLESEDFGKKLVEGMKFLSQNEGPFLIHCTEGKDRAGFASALVECLMGASLDEVVADYMTSFSNYYGVEAGSEKYAVIAQSNIISSLTTVVCGLPKGSDISGINLEAYAEKYLMANGMTRSEVRRLKSTLAGK